MQYRVRKYSLVWQYSFVRRLLGCLAVLSLLTQLCPLTGSGEAGFVAQVYAAPKGASRTASAKTAGSVQQIVGNPRSADAAAPNPAKNRKSKASTARLRTKRAGQPIEVRVVQSDGREQVIRGYAERAGRRASANAAARAGSTDDARERRVLRVHVPGG